MRNQLDGTGEEDTGIILIYKVNSTFHSHAELEITASALRRKGFDVVFEVVSLKPNFDALPYVLDGLV